MTGPYNTMWRSPQINGILLLRGLQTASRRFRIYHAFYQSTATDTAVGVPLCLSLKTPLGLFSQWPFSGMFLCNHQRGSLPRTVSRSFSPSNTCLPSWGFPFNKEITWSLGKIISLMSKISPLWTFRILAKASWVCYPITRHKSFSHGLWLGWCGGLTLVLHHWYKRLPCKCDAKSHGHLSSSPKNSSWIQHTCSRLCSLTPTPSPTLQTTKTMSFVSASLCLV